MTNEFKAWQTFITVACKDRVKVFNSFPHFWASDLFLCDIFHSSIAVSAASINAFFYSWHVWVWQGGEGEKTEDKPGGGGCFEEDT